MFPNRLLMGCLSVLVAASMVLAGCTTAPHDDLFGDPGPYGQVVSTSSTGSSASTGVAGATGGAVDASIDATGGAGGAGGAGGPGGAAGDGAAGTNDARDGASSDGAGRADVGPAPGCGGEQQVCCAGARCTAPFTFCKEGKCTACGEWGGDCCPDFGCRNTGCCSNSVCVANGGNCEMTPSANLCKDGACRDCGSEGRTCCGFRIRTCQQGLACVADGRSDQCVKCGAMGQSCCGLTGSRFCNGDLACGSDGHCQQCGVANGPCCAGDTCGTGLVCDTDKTCRPCGTAAQICCQKGGKPVCDDGFLCQSDNHCAHCGAGGEVCCDGRKCASGSCIRSGDAEGCQNDCGAQGQPCCKVADCPNGQCDGCLFGLDCDLAKGECASP